MSPNSRAHNKNSISSADGLAMLRKWKKHEIVLCFVAFEFSDRYLMPRVRVLEAGPAKVKLVSVQTGNEYVFDPRETEFRLGVASENPLPEEVLATLGNILEFRPKDGIPRLLAEELLEQ